MAFLRPTAPGSQTPLAPDKARMVMEASLGLVHDALAAGLDICTAQDRFVEKDRSKIPGTLFTQEQLDSMTTPSYDTMKKKVETAVGRCEIAFRSSVCTQQSVTKYAYLLEEARHCNRDHAAAIAEMYDEDDVFGVILDSAGISTSDQDSCYGVRRDIERDGKKLLQMYAKIGRITAAIFDTITTYKLMSHAPSFSASASQTALMPTCKTIAEGIGRLRAALQQKSSTLPSDVRSRLIQYMMGRHTAIQKAQSVWLELQERIDVHVNFRYGSSFSWLTDKIGTDLLGQIMDFVDFRSASACLKTCKEMNSITHLKTLLPHLSVRWVPGVFPHVVAPSIEPGECGYIARKTLVHLYTDFVIKGPKRTDAASARLQTTPTEQPEGANPGFQTREDRLRKKRDEDSRAARESEDETPDASRFRRRLGHETFFGTPIKCAYDLVFADTLEIVPSATGISCLVFPKGMRKPNAPTSTYTSLSGVPYPAHVSFYTDDLSAHYSNRKFKIKVTGFARTLTNINKDEDSVYQQTLVAYSPMFEIVSTKKVSSSVRQRAQEESARKEKKQKK